MNRASVPVEERPALLLAARFVKLMVGLWLDVAVFLGVVVINALWASYKKIKQRRLTSGCHCQRWRSHQRRCDLQPPAARSLASLRRRP